MLNRLQAVFESLHYHEVRYLVMGGIAAILHGVPRATFDLNILIDPTHDNGNKLLAALHAAGLGTAEMLTVEELLENEITVFNDILRIDVQTFTPGVTFSKAWKNRVQMLYNEQKILVFSKADLIASKRAAGRQIDIQDADALDATL